MIQFQPTVLLGVGPSGKRFLENFKKCVIETYGDLPAIKLLAIDAPMSTGIYVGGAESESEPHSILGPTELLELSVSGCVPADPVLARQRFPWLSEQIEDCGQDWLNTRAAVRAAFHTQFTDIQNMVEFHFQRLNNLTTQEAMGKKGFTISTERAEVSLVVAGAVGEIAGSALLLDATYMVISIFRRAGMQIGTTGLLFVPPVVPSSPEQEAIAYAALKEINQAIETQQSPVTLPGRLGVITTPPFNRGCFVIDNRNERNLGLTSQDEVIDLAANWIFRIMLTPLKGRIEDFGGDQYINRSRNRTTAYGALGLATYVLPVYELIDWCANRLGNEILMSEVLDSSLFRNASNRLIDFYNINQLRPDPLREQKLGVGRDHLAIRKSADVLGRIRGLSTQEYSALPGQFKAISRLVSGQDLPEVTRQIQKNALSVQKNFQTTLQDEVTQILQLWPKGGLSLAMQFTQRLQRDFQQFAETLNRREKTVRAKNVHQVEVVKAQARTLDRVVACMPELPVLIASGVGTLAAASLFSIWMWQAREALGTGLAVVFLLLLWFLILGGAVYAYHTVMNEIEEVRDKCIHELETYYQGEVDVRVIQEARQLYPELSQTAQDQIDRLGELQTVVRSAAACMKPRLNPEPMCGVYGFALQTSVLTPEIMDGLYTRTIGAGGSEAQLAPMLNNTGNIDSWMRRTAEEIEAQVLDFCRKVFDGMKAQRVEQLLREQLPTTDLKERKVDELYNKAAPLLLIDTFQLGPEAGSGLQTFVGMERDESEFRTPFVDINPSTIVESTGDPYCMLVTSIRRGLPLFALRRLGEFQKHYMETINDNGHPLHLEDEVALAPDLVPLFGDHDEIDSALSFAVGRALGFVRQNPESGVYGVCDRTGKLVKALSRSKVNSVIKLSADKDLLTRLSEYIQAQVSEKGASAAASWLQNELDREQGQLSAWEQRQVRKYIDLLQS